MNKITIPESIKNICKELAKVAQEQGLQELSGGFNGAEGWDGKVSFFWKAGRHGEDQNEITIQSEFFVYEKIRDVKGN